MTTASHQERLISGAGGFVAILVVFWVTRQAENEIDAQMLLIASMGASAVLLFAVPHAPMSQPWNVIGGHVISALIGVSMHHAIADPVVASACAAGLAITAMHYAHCLHPPGGASAVIPVISGAGAEQFGAWVVIFPIGVGALLMVVLAVIWNLPFPWRRYPQRLAAAMAPPRHMDGYPDIRHADFVAALAEIDTFVDISEDDLLRVYDIAMRTARTERN